MARLSLSFLGPPQIELEGNAVKLESGRSTGLLAYLAMAHGAARRDALVLLLWPDAEPSEGRHYLRQTLYSINKRLPGQWLSSDRDTIALADTDGLRVDVRRFRELLSQCSSHGHSDIEVCPKCRLWLEKAASLYTGDFLSDVVLMDSENFDDWAGMQTENLKREYETALHRLIRHLNELGEHEKAIGYGRAWLALDRLNEIAHQWLMQLYNWIGDRTSALRQYQDCVNVLKEEVNTEPLEETKRLFEKIKAGNEASNRTSLLSPQAAQIKNENCAEIQPASQVRRHNLPAQTTSLIGREKEVGHVVDLLRKPDVRLVTLCGPGGVGKTRLGIHVAEQLIDDFDSGVFFIALDSLSEADMVEGVIGNALGLQESREMSMSEILKNYVKERQILLVLDNFEHLLAAAKFASELLAVGANLKILVTSREVLRLQGEHEYPVPSLSLPDLPSDSISGVDQVDELNRYGAFRLFMDRATAIRPDFSITFATAISVVEICRRLDGLPLAIELAAARIRVFPPDEVLRRLDKSLSLLTRGARDLPSRLQSLRGAIAWSYELLSEEEQSLFRRLSVFVGGFTMETAKEVCKTDTNAACDVLEVITSLEEKSLIRREENVGEPKYTMLQTVREYALEKLNDRGEEEDAVQRFCSAYSDFAAKAEPYYRGPDQVTWLNKIDREYANVLAALQWQRELGEFERGLRLAKSMGEFWRRRAYFSDGRYWLTTFLKLSEGRKLPHEQGWAYLHLGDIEFTLMVSESDRRQELQHYERSLALHRDSGDRRGEALALCSVGYMTSWLGNRDSQGNPAKNTRDMLNESINIARETGDAWTIAFCSYWKMEIKRQQGESEFPEEELKQVFQQARQTGDPLLMSIVLPNEFYEDAKLYSAAAEWLIKDLELGVQISNKEIITGALEQLARVYLKFGKPADAWDYASRCIQNATETGAKMRSIDGLGWMIIVAIAESRLQIASRLAGIRSAIVESDASKPSRTMDWDDAVKIELDEETFIKEWTIGREMTEREILQYISENPFK